MMPIHRVVMTLFLLLPASFARSQESPESASPQAASPSSEDGSAADRPSSQSLRVLNPDGSPAAGAKVLIGDTNRLRVIFNGEALSPPAMGGGMGEMMMGDGMREPREVAWRQTDQKGQIELSGRDFRGMGGGMGMYMEMGTSAPRTSSLPPLFFRDGKTQFAFLPPGSERETVSLRKAGELQVKLPLPTSDSLPDLSVLAWWNNGFALPRQPKELGYDQPDLVGRGWKFQSYFAVFQTARLRWSHDPFRGETAEPFGGAPAHAVAALLVPPGEVRLTLLPAGELQPSQAGKAAPGAAASQSGVAAADLGYSRLVELGLYGGPSRIVSAESGKQTTVSFHDCSHSIQVRTQSSSQTLPQWDESLDDDTAVFLIREVDVPGEAFAGDDRPEVRPGSAKHESLLVRTRSLRSQLPPVRIGRRTAADTYRFDLLPPGTYRVRVGKPLDLRHATPPDYSELGEPARVRVMADSAVDTYAISFAPDREGWDETLVIEPKPSGRRNEAPFGRPDNDPFGPDGEGNDPFGSGNRYSGGGDPFGGDGDPFGGGGDPFGGDAEDDPFGAPDRGESAEPGQAPSGGPDPDERKASRRQQRLQELKARIRRLQQQLEVAARLVEQMETDAGTPSR